MNLTELMADMRVELSDAATFWSDGELTRAVQKSVSLMSRIQPKRAVVETTIVIDVEDESFTTPTAASAIAIVNAQTLSGVSAGDTVTIADNTPDVPRRMTVTLTDADASVTSLTIIVKGYDQDGNYIEESWYLADLVTTVAKQGSLYFKRVTEVEVDTIGGAGAGDTISVGNGNAYDSYIYLANKAIKPGSATVTSDPAGTTYVLDTDYTMDYINGGIKFINGGDMAAATGYLISYDLDPRLLDISALLPKKSYIKIEKVEYIVGDDPITYLNHEEIGDVLYVKGEGVTLTEDNHLRIIYLKPWAAPAANADGDYPEHLDDPIIIGSCGQALIFKAEKYVQQAITEIALVNAAADSMATPLADINSALDKCILYLETAGTTDNAVDVLANVTDDAAELRDKMTVALAAAATTLGTVLTTSIDKATTGAEAYLDAGDDYITTINDAERVAEKYAEYARARAALANVRIAQAREYMNEAQIRIATISSYVAEAGGWCRISEDFLQEAAQRVAEVNAWAAQADRYTTTSRQYMEIAGRYLASGQAKITEMLIALGVKAEYASARGASAQFE